MKTNFIYALRNIRKNLTNSLITTIGLTVAIACCLLIYFFVNQEYSFNNFHKKGDRIYRLNYNRKYADGGEWPDTRFRGELIDIIKDKVPEVEKCTEYRNSNEQLVEYEDEFYDINMSYTREDFFSIFTHEFIAGDKEGIFQNPDEIVITKEFADIIIKGNQKEYSSLLGQSLRFPLDYEDNLFRITGIIDNIPRNSGIQFQGIIPGENGTNFGGCNNYYGNASLYYLLKEKANTKLAQQKIDQVVLDFYADRIENDKKQNILTNSNDAFTPYSIALPDIYFTTNISNCYEEMSNKKNSSILITIGAIILLIACINYSILSLGQYMKKIGDIGIRKYMGAKKKDVFSLFFTEGFMLTSVAFILGIVLCSILIPVFGRLSRSEIFTELIDFRKAIIFSSVTFFAIVFITSIIPVLFFSNISPNQISAKKLSLGSKSSISQIFVSFQYSTSIILIIVTIFIIKQSNFLRNKSLGIRTENVIDIANERLDDDQKVLFRDMLKEHAGIKNLTLVARNFMNGSSDGYVDKGDGEKITTYLFKVDEEYIPTMELQLTHGRNFTEANIKDGDNSMIVNEKFVETMLIQEDPIGKTYNIWGEDFTIIGVVKDYHFRDMRQTIKPSMLYTRRDMGNNYHRTLVRYYPEQLSEVVDHIKECYGKIAPGKILDYSFWDEELGNRYETEERWSKIIGSAAAIAIIISSLGLFGLTILLINQRIKEIGVRKVNGAMEKEVLFTILKSFLIWLLGSLIIAAPLARLIINKWLEGFPYKTDVSWWIFALSGMITLIIALVTVGWQSWRAASRNPVEALRYE